MAKLTALEEFKSQKEELLAKLDALQETIDFLELDHKNKLNEIEKKVIIDKDRYLLTEQYLQNHLLHAKILLIFVYQDSRKT